MNQFIGLVPSRVGLLILTFLGCGLLLQPAKAANYGYFDGRMWRLNSGSATQSLVAVDEEGKLFISGVQLGAITPLLPRLSRWDGREWRTVLTNNPSFSVIQCAGRQLIGAGRFSRIEGVAATNIARWDDGQWFPLGPGLNGAVQCLAVLGSRLYVGGALTNAGALAITNVASWDFATETWSALADGLPGKVSVLAPTPDGIVAAWFADDLTYVSRWTGAAWQPVATLTGLFNPPRIAISDMVWHQDSLIITGGFKSIDGAELKNLARWRGGTWEAVGDNALNGPPVRLAVADGDLFAGGEAGILADGPFSQNGVLRMRRNHWEVSLGSEATAVTALVGHGRELFAIGSLKGTAPIAAGNNRIYWQFDGERWSPQNGGLTDILETSHLARHGDGVVVALRSGIKSPLFYDGTRFLRTTSGPGPNSVLVSGNTAIASDGKVAHAPATLVAGGQATNIIARLEGFDWMPATQPMPLVASVIAFGGGRIFAGGRDPAQPGVATTVLAWDGTAWQRLGGTFNNPEIPDPPGGLIDSLVWLDGALFAGGSFTNVDGAALANLARWNGSAWEPAGDFDGPVTGLTAGHGALHVVGNFTRVGNLLANRYATWNGQDWQTLGGGVSAILPSAVAISVDGLIVVSGQSTALNGSRLLFWRGGQWESPETGNLTDFPLIDALWIGNDLYLAPTFPIVGPTESIGLAIWHENGPRLIPSLSGNTTAIRVTGGTSSRFAVERSTDFQNWLPFATNALGNPGQHFSDPAPPASEAFYRVRELE